MNDCVKIRLSRSGGLTILGLCAAINELARRLREEQEAFRQIPPSANPTGAETKVIQDLRSDLDALRKMREDFESLSAKHCL